MKRLYTTFLRLKLAAANLRRGPNPGLKLAAAYFSRKEIVRSYRRSRLIFARINGPIINHILRVFIPFIFIIRV